jgi:hypothetical protein
VVVAAVDYRGLAHLGRGGPVVPLVVGGELGGEPALPPGGVGVVEPAIPFSVVGPALLSELRVGVQARELAGEDLVAVAAVLRSLVGALLVSQRHLAGPRRA